MSARWTRHERDEGVRSGALCPSCRCCSLVTDAEGTHCAGHCDEDGHTYEDDDITDEPEEAEHGC